MQALVTSLGRDDAWPLLRAADQLANAAMWLVVHQTYARTVYLDGRALAAADFKENPEGHTGGALNNLVFKYPGWRAREGFSQPALGVPGESDDPEMKK